MLDAATRQWTCTMPGLIGSGVVEQGQQTFHKNVAGATTAVNLLDPRGPHDDRSQKICSRSQTNCSHDTPTVDAKSERVRSMVDAALGAAKAAAASSMATASAGPATHPKTSITFKAPAALRVPAPAAGGKVPAFVPTSNPRPPISAPPSTLESSVGARLQGRNFEHTSSHSHSETSKCSRSRSRDRRRRRHSHGRRRSRGHRRKRHKSLSCSQKGNRKQSVRGSVFTDTADATAASQFAQPKLAQGRSVQLSPQEVPEWLQDLAAQPTGPCRKKILRMSDAFVKCLIGRGGETIRFIINRTGADIQVRSAPQDPEGIVSIVGNVEAAENMIREVLASKGCYMTTTGAYAPQYAAPGLALPTQADQDVLKIPSELVGLFIGAEGSGIKDIKSQVGGAVSIKVLAPILPGGFQEVQVVGDHWQSAKEIARAKIEEYKKITPGRWNMPGWWHTPGSNIVPPQNDGDVSLAMETVGML